MESNFADASALFHVLGSITPLSAPFQERIAKQLITEEFPAKHLLLKPTEIARRIFFIKKGFLRIFIVDENGKECTTWFMGENELMISVYSFFTQQPAEEYIEVLGDCIIQSLTWAQLQSYYADFKEGNLVGRLITERYYMVSEERSIFMRTKSPEERYKILLNQYPKIEQFTTQINIATYLGITRETLSRIKTRMMSRN